MNDAAQRILFERLQTCADQLEARVEASDPLSDSDIDHLVLTLRDLADLAAPAAETTAASGGNT